MQTESHDNDRTCCFIGIDLRGEFSPGFCVVKIITDDIPAVVKDAVKFRTAPHILYQPEGNLEEKIRVGFLLLEKYSCKVPDIRMNILIMGKRCFKIGLEILENFEKHIA